MYILPRGSIVYNLYTNSNKCIVIGTYEYCRQVMIQIEHSRIKKSVSFNDQVCMCYY